jgi:hypothetical protein
MYDFPDISVVGTTYTFFVIPFYQHWSTSLEQYSGTNKYKALLFAMSYGV